ncbi:sarcosine oxidase subunit alpha [Chitinivorax tropicus]|uniref:Sarcosine oxidase subunit alpha n=1 Tax=Chitinivorax tropicus TaxID=714531 RepID=A0A840MQL1_9PROT|nr:2Fe-2S iron-sulfur cluster-binding protein [Chitinivorax tropicus]MBB5019062.1 sarcosine oxidase subunit alpha [Chitinivorax tropicus]
MKLIINGQTVELATVAPMTVAAALAMSKQAACRQSSRLHEPRQAFCGMGMCFECRVTINGLPHQRACQVWAEDGMEIHCDA